ncbi:cold-shock protein [bacterium]|nr:cold-shock protein [bacterium]MBU1880852.1 cold-shock protein [bacterium]
MAEGTVKWFNPSKGFGFITADDGAGDVFVHVNEIAGTGYRQELSEEQRVEFEVVEGPKGLSAKNVHVIE